MSLAAAALFATSLQARCAGCHRAEAVTQTGTPMAHALERAADSAILKSHSLLSFQSGGYHYAIRREGSRSLYTVTNGKDAITVPILWSFGLGAAGQTYVYERSGTFFESRVSFYNALSGLDLTMGAQNTAPRSLEEAAGRKMDANDARDCFNCHATGAVNGNALAIDSLIPGVQCERCHSGAAEHAAGVERGDASKARMPKMSALTSEEMSELCGGCHRTWAQIAAGGPRGILNVRFQPYRLTLSKCYDAADRRITCTACHNPHDHGAQRRVSYDARCQACHNSASRSAKVCKTGSKDCVSCHMPKVELPGAHFAFTDHFIRVARPGEPYPD